MWVDDFDDVVAADEDVDADEDEPEELRHGQELWFALHDDGLWATFTTLCEKLEGLFVDPGRIVYHQFLSEVMAVPITSDTSYWTDIYQAVRRTARLYVLDVDPCALDTYVNKMFE